MKRSTNVSAVSAEATHESVIRTTIGAIRVESDQDGAIVAIGLASGKRVSARPTAAAARVEKQLREYLAGARREFDLELRPRGTPFQHKVWAQLRAIPFGVTKSYADIASAIGKPNAARAVGAACGRNPIGIVVPCHRVVGSRGGLTGYYWGTEMKARLLALEGVDVDAPLFSGGA